MSLPQGERRLVVLTAPSGAGKTTIARRILAAMPDLQFSVSVTTRPSRPGEQEGHDYYFVDLERFRKFVRSGALLEFEEVYPGRYYGTLRSEVGRLLRLGPVLLDIDVRGALSVKKIYGDSALAVFIQPPSLETLAARLRARGTESKDAVAVRLGRAREELALAPQFDVTVVNDDLEEAVEETLSRIREFLAR